MKVRSCGCLVLCNVLLGGFCTRYVIEVWGTHITHAAIHAPLIPCTVSSLFRRLGLAKGASLHVLRHTHASVPLANGVDLATVSERLGHSSVRVIAEIYSHPIRGRDRQTAEWPPQRLAGPQPYSAALDRDATPVASGRQPQSSDGNGR